MTYYPIYVIKMENGIFATKLIVLLHKWGTLYHKTPETKFMKFNLKYTISNFKMNEKIKFECIWN